MKKQTVAYKPRPSQTRKRPTTVKKRVATSKKRAVLVHVRHTGRILPRQHTSYPLLAFIVLLVGVVMAGCTVLAKADTGYTVSARVPGTPPHSPAIITSQAAGIHFSNTPITVSGRCPNLAAYVKLYRNDLFSGVAVCDSSSTFTIQTDLFPGANALVTHVFNAGDSEGPVSPAFTVYYDAPPSSRAAAETTHANPSQPMADDGTTSALPSLSVADNFNYQATTVGQACSWQLSLTSGTAPYTVNVNWGDSQSSTYTRNTTGNFVIAHTYDSPVTKLTAKTVTVSITDAAHKNTMIQLVALLAPAGGFTGATGTTGTGSAGKNSSTSTQSGATTPGAEGVAQSLANKAWPTYSVVVLMLVCFWLGEHRILTNRFNRFHPRKPRHV